MANWIEKLQSAVTSHRKRLFVWQAGDGQLLLLPHGARVLGCQMPGVEANLFWHHPGMEEASTAGEHLAAAGGGLGGDRLWIAPEVAYMWPDLEEARKAPFDCYDLPQYMDPGEWRIIGEGEGYLYLMAEMTLVDHRSDRKISLEVGRQVRVLEAPDGLPAGVSCCAFAIHNAMTVVGGDEGAVAGLWDLLQMPVGGTIICATPKPVTEPPRSYYEPYRAGDIDLLPGAVHFHSKGDYMIKMGLAPEQTTGRMAYVRQAGGGVTTAIVRSFLPVPGAAYIDVPRDSDATFGGDALQTFCDDGRFEGFTEMEYHEPALIAGEAATTHCGTCVTQVLAGADAAVRQAVSQLIGV